MAVIFCDGFDDRLNLDNGTGEGNFNTGWGLYPNGVWDGDDVGGARGIIAGEGRYGGNAMSLEHTGAEFDGDLQSLSKTFSEATEFVFGCAFRSTLAFSLKWYVWTGSFWRVLVNISIEPHGRVLVKRRVAGGASTQEDYVVGQGIKAVSQYGWHYLHGKMAVGKGTGLDSIEIYVDGIEAVSATSLTLSQAYGGPTRADFPSASQECDDIYLVSGTLTMPGEVRIPAVFPSGAGAAADFTPTGVSANWEAVDEVDQDFDTTYNSSAGTSGHADSFPVQPVTAVVPVAQTVHNVTVRCMASADSGEQIKPFLLIGGTRYYGSNYSPPSGRYEYAEFVWETNPATASAWTLAAIDALEIGYEVV